MHLNILKRNKQTIPVVLEIRVYTLLLHNFMLLLPCP